MRKIILIGCRGAGKSSLAKAISRRTGIDILEYGNPVVVTEDENILENYINTRIRYIDFTISTLKKKDRGDDKPILQVRGPETLYSYSVFSPFLKGKSWDMELVMKKEFDYLMQYYSEIVIMLDFDREVIRKRRINDAKVRTNMEFWETLWFDYERTHFLKFDNLIRISDPSLTIEKCADLIIPILKDRNLC